MLKKGLDTAKIDSLNLVSTSKKRLLEFLTSRIAQSRKTFVVTPNPEFFVFARHNPWFEAILEKADLAIPDGAGLIWASRILGQPIKERISGIDLMEKLCQEATKRDWSVYLLGGSPGVADAAAAKLKINPPAGGSKLKIWAESGPELELEAKDTSEWIRKINQRKPTFLFVAFGMGKQEKFIWDNWDKLNVKLAMGVGGAFDYISGQIPRAPKWIQKAGLEWLFRLIHEPWRLKRQLRLIEFIWLVLREKLFRKT